jgi:hypothetical protein
MSKNTVFGQVVQLLSRKEFKRIVSRCDGDKHIRKLDCWQQLMILLYAQIKDLTSLREIETSLKSHDEDWDSIGIDTVARSTVSDANAKRSSLIYEEMFNAFLRKCHEVSPGHSFRVSMPVFTQDATLIPLCLSAFPWAKYRKRKGAMKLHMLLDHEGYLPSFVRMTDGKCHEVNVVKKPEYDFPDLPPDSILTVDRGYVDYQWLYSLHCKGVVFVIRAKCNMAFDEVGQHAEPVDSRGIISDELIEFTNYYEKKAYPDRLRRITYRYIDTNGKEDVITVITNSMKLAASTIAALYKGRWEIETFFRWIKQNLKIKTFIGTSENAVMTQVWVALILYLLLSFIKYQTRFKASITELLRIIREVLLNKVSLIEYLRTTWDKLMEGRRRPVQLSFL